MKTTIAIVTVGVIIGAILLLANKSSSSKSTNPTEKIQNVSVIEGKQIIEISAKGGYSPKKSVAKAHIPTILRFNTKGTFDCSSSVRIASMDISRSLPNSGSLDIELGNPQTGKLQGTCSMGMYAFEVDFH